MIIDNIQKEKVVFVHVNEREAIQLIQSLSAQLNSGNANEGRREFYTIDGTYFSIGVDFGEKKLPRYMIRPDDREVFELNENGKYHVRAFRQEFPDSIYNEWTYEVLKKYRFEEKN